MIRAAGLFPRGRVRAWLRGPERPWVLGHRGARKQAPENTLLSFERALEEGADGVELDVRLDRDGDVVVIHDASLERVTGGRDLRSVTDLSRADLDAIDVGAGERVPRLAEVLAWARARGARLNIELKAAAGRRALLVAKVALLVAAQPLGAESIILSSFDPTLVGAAARLLPWVPVGYLIEERSLPGPRRTNLLLGAVALHPHASLVTPSAIAPWQRARRPVNVWTVNDPVEARRLDAAGVDCLITDEPAKILDALCG